MNSRADGLRWVKVALPLLLVLGLGLYPRSFEAENGLALSTRRLATQAAGGFSQAAAALPWRGDLHEQAGLAALQAGDSQAAVSELTAAQANRTITFAGILALGDAYQAAGDPAQAVSTWQAAMVFPGADLPQVYSRLETAYQASGDLDSLFKTLTRHAAVSPQDAQVLYRLGLVETLTAFDQASGALNQASLLDAGLSTKVHTIQTGLILAGKSTDASYRLLLAGRALGAAGEWDTALLAFERATALDPKNYEALAFHGEALYQLGKDGYPDLEKAIQADPSSVLIQALQAVYWLRNGQPERALVYLHAAAAQEPQNPVWQAELGETLAAMGSLDAAAAYFQSAVRLAPKDPAYWRSLATFCLRYQYLVRDLGLPSARQAVLLNDKDPLSLDLMGQVFAALTDLTSARRFFERAIAADPGSADAHFHMGYILLQLGETQPARDELLLALKLQPNSNAGQQANRLLKQYYP